MEVFRDVAFRVFPITRKEGYRMLSELKSYPLLAGIRGRTSLDIKAIVETVLKMGEVLAVSEDIEEVEINPLFAYHEGVKAVDARVIIKNKR